MRFTRHHDHSLVSGRLIDILDDLNQVGYRLREDEENISGPVGLPSYQTAIASVASAIRDLEEAISNVQQDQEREVTP